MSIVLEIKVGKAILRGRAFWWEKLRQIGKGGHFTVRTLDQAGNDHIGSVRDFVRRLEKAGYVEQIDTAPRNGDNQKIYEIVKAPRILPPLTRDGSLGVQGRRVQSMWNHMRSAPRFSFRTLADFASVEGAVVSRETAKSYIKRLNEAGYLVTLEEGRPRHPAVYRLKRAKNTGPCPPMILRSKMVWDQNTKELMTPIVAEEDV